MRIESAKNSSVKETAALGRDAKLRRRTGLFVAEGIKMVSEAPRDRVVNIYAGDSFLASGGDALLGDAVYTEVSDRAFEAMSNTKTPQGVLAVVRQEHYEEKDMLAGVPFLLCLEDIRDPGNLGTMLRAGEAAGITGVIAGRGTADFYNPKTVRSTMGSIYRVPHMYTDNIVETIDGLVRAGVMVYAAALEGSVPYDSVDYGGACAFLIGNEANGLSAAAVRAACGRVKIPMHGKVESLNAAAAACVLMFEAARQRRQTY